MSTDPQPGDIQSQSGLKAIMEAQVSSSWE